MTTTNNKAPVPQITFTSTPLYSVDTFLLKTKQNKRKRAMDQLSGLINFSDAALIPALLIIPYCPTAWNILARLEYRFHILTKLAFGNKYVGCYALAAYIFSSSAYRDYLFKKALESQPTHPLLENPLVLILAVGFYLFGLVLVLTSMFRLGITGTYLGDYFGILMTERVVDFPFNFMENPMYNGSTLCFLGHALWHASPAGIMLSGVVFVVYQVALMFEGPFTSYIYEQDAKKKSKSK